MKFDVFISFREIDTRRTFVSHLLLSLFRKQITIFKHEEEMPGNQPPSSQVLQAIEESKIGIAVISKNYAASSSCLDELAKIIDCKEKGSLVVVPIFYEVDPSDVIRQVDDLVDHGDEDNHLVKVKRWRDALAKSIQIYHQDYSYWESEDSYSYILDRVMIHVSHCLIATPPSDEEIRGGKQQIPFQFMSGQPPPIRDPGAALGKESGKPTPSPWIYCSMPTPPIRDPGIEFESAARKNLSRFFISNDSQSFVGMNRLMKAVVTLLDLEARDRSLEIGIWGGRGVGKTTLARCIYQQISPQFQDHLYFTVDTTNCSLGTCLLEDITRAALMQEADSLDEVVKAKLGHRKVLLIVDDLCNIEHLGNIREFARWFGPGSRLIFVTEDKNSLLQCGDENLYEVESLRYDEALQLFSQFAFNKEHVPSVPREYHRLSVRAVLITGRIPLALKVLGSFLRGKFIYEWECLLCTLEASQDKFVAEVSTNIGNHFS